MDTTTAMDTYDVPREKMDVLFKGHPTVFVVHFE